ncbi:hypothetical protein [Pectinatus sottacetonis]|uniref:hypothetical protein n=1 Tax=Pectinatus sottacetonis TaxID=1002795 RepID=UPI0018C54BB3|nr:hypothetical protein [Pectinatus sottacetonis]
MAHFFASVFVLIGSLIEYHLQNILYGSKDAYLDKIISAGFNGSFLDIVDGYENFE